MSFQFWRRWLMAVTGGVMVYSAALILLPTVMQRLFDTLFFASPDLATQFGAEANAYIRFVYGVLGAVIIGWMVTFMSLLIGAFQHPQRSTWRTLTLSIAVWFVVDSGFSVAIGIVPHAIFNIGFLILFAIPLAATYRQLRDGS